MRTRRAGEPGSASDSSGVRISRGLPSLFTLADNIPPLRVLAGRICRVFWTMWFLEGYQSSCEYGCHPAVGLHLNLTQLGRKTFEHTDTQTHKHTDPRTHRQTNPQTHRHPDTRTQDTKHTSLQSPRHTNTQIPEHISTKTPRHTNTQTHKPINAQIR